MSKDGKPPRTPRSDDAQIFEFPTGIRVDRQPRSPEQLAADEVRRLAGEAQIDAARMEAEAKKTLETAFRTVETAHKPGQILEAWKFLNARGRTTTLSRATLRCIDMHLALTDPNIIEQLKGRDPTTDNLIRTLDQYTHGNGEPDARPNVINKNGPFSYLTEKGQVETGANERTRKEHERARLGVEVALLTTRMRDMLHILDNQIGTTLGNKLTTVEKACINDHLTSLLKGGHWEHPTQDMAESFAAWEKILGDAHNVSDLTITPEPANFQAEPLAVRAGHALPTFKQKVPMLTNIINAPGAAWREFLNLLPGDNKKR